MKHSAIKLEIFIGWTFLSVQESPKYLLGDLGIGCESLTAWRDAYLQENEKCSPPRWINIRASIYIREQNCSFFHCQRNINSRELKYSCKLQLSRPRTGRSIKAGSTQVHGGLTFSQSNLDQELTKGYADMTHFFFIYNQRHSTARNGKNYKKKKNSMRKMIRKRLTKMQSWRCMIKVIECKTQQNGKFP